MTISRFLFNDLFHDDPNAGNWVLNRKLGNPKEDDEIIATLRDGRIETVESFINNDTPNNWIFGIEDVAPTEICTGFGLINTTMAGCTIQGSAGSRYPIIGKNMLFHNPENPPSSRATLYIDSTANNPVGGQIGLLYAGCVEEFNLLYPVGYKPPFVRNYDDRIALSDSGYPIARHRKRSPLKCVIPFRFLVGESEAARVVALIEKMQRQPFLWQWNADDPDHTMFAWLEAPSPQLSFTAANIMQADINIAGYFDYDN